MLTERVSINASFMSNAVPKCRYFPFGPIWSPAFIPRRSSRFANRASPWIIG